MNSKTLNLKVKTRNRRHLQYFILRRLFTLNLEICYCGVCGQCRAFLEYFRILASSVHISLLYIHREFSTISLILFSFFADGHYCSQNTEFPMRNFQTIYCC